MEKVDQKVRVGKSPLSSVATAIIWGRWRGNENDREAVTGSTVSLTPTIQAWKALHSSSRSALAPGDLGCLWHSGRWRSVPVGRRGVENEKAADGTLTPGPQQVRAGALGSESLDSSLCSLFSKF